VCVDALGSYKLDFYGGGIMKAEKLLGLVGKKYADQ